MDVDLAAGTYEVACKPGQTGDGIRQKITVTGASGGGDVGARGGLRPRARAVGRRQRPVRARPGDRRPGREDRVQARRTRPTAPAPSSSRTRPARSPPSSTSRAGEEGEAVVELADDRRLDRHRRGRRRGHRADPDRRPTMTRTQETYVPSVRRPRRRRSRRRRPPQRLHVGRGRRRRDRADRHRLPLRGGQHRAGRRAPHLRHHQQRLQGDRGLRLREARRRLHQDRHREGEHRPRHVLRPDRRRWSRACTRSPASRARRATASGRRSRSPAAGDAQRPTRPPTKAVAHYRTYVQQQADAVVPLVDEFVGRGQGRRRREGQVAVRRVADPVGGRRAGRRELRRPRPEGRPARGRPRGRPGVDRLAPDREGAVDRRRPDRAWGRSPTSSPTDVRELQRAGADRRHDGRLDRQRRQGAARRGRHRQDHRRGGGLLAHRPGRLPGQPRRRQEGLRGAPPAGRRTTDLLAELDAAFAAVQAAARQAPRRRHLRVLRHRRPRRSAASSPASSTPSASRCPS